MQIITLGSHQKELIEQAAVLLVRGFQENWPESWPNLEAARAEVLESLQPDRIALAAIDDTGAMSGWIGAVYEYDGRAWELHPLVVDPERQGQGIGRALVEALEKELRHRGAVTVYLGSDDENDTTSLGGVNLYDDLWGKIAAIQNLKGHPYSFYQKLGYQIVGVIPDANGLGKPDILMAKRLIPW